MFRLVGAPPLTIPRRLLAGSGEVSDFEFAHELIPEVDCFTVGDDFNPRHLS